MDLLGGSDSDGGEEVEFKINKKYAKGYKQWRSKEEKQKLIDKYGEVNEESSSSEEEEIRSSKQMDKDWLRAYAVVHFQQDRLYKEGEQFFRDEAKPTSKKKEKPTTLKDYERNFLLEKGGIESDDDTDEKPQGKSYFEEQEEIKKSLKEAVGDSSSDENDDALLVKQPKTKEQQIKEENEYLEWLKGERDDLEDSEAAKELAPLKAYWNDPNLSEKERVLRDYVLNNGYMDQEESDDSDDSEGPDRDEEEEFLEKAEDYEHKYNFRHEEPGADEIKSYPRVIEESVRNKDTRRIEKRKRRMEKKQAEKEERQEEIRLLQKLHKEERREKLKKLRDVASNPELDYDLEADFNPEEHDKIMQTYFGTVYYGDGEVEEKPTFEYDAAIDDEPDDWWNERLKEGQGEHRGINDEEEDGDAYNGDGENGNFNMDADYDSSEEILSRKEKKKRLKSEKKQKQKKKLPLFDPTTKTFDEYVDEYLKDKIGILPFTYREVVPNDFGLTTAEILTAKEKELNTWVSVKKMSQYRSKEEEITDRRKFTSRSKQPGKKMKVIPSLFKKPEEDTDEKEKKKKEKQQMSDEEGTSESESPDKDTPSTSRSDPSVSGTKKTSRLKETDTVSLPQKKEKTKKKRKSHDSPTDQALSTSPPKKKKKTEEHSMSSESLGKVKSKSQDKTKGSSEKHKVKEFKKSLPCDKEQSSGKEKNRPNTSTSEQDKMKKVKTKNNQDIQDKAFNKAAHLVSSGSVKKKKKKKKIKSSSDEPSQETENQSQNKAGSLPSKKKKKKLSISNFNNKSQEFNGAEVKETKKKLQQKLSQMMSASRLSKFGIGPKASKGSKSKRKKMGKMQ